MSAAQPGPSLDQVVAQRRGSAIVGETLIAEPHFHDRRRRKGVRIAQTKLFVFRVFRYNGPGKLRSEMDRWVDSSRPNRCIAR